MRGGKESGFLSAMNFKQLHQLSVLFPQPPVVFGYVNIVSYQVVRVHHAETGYSMHFKTGVLLATWASPPGLRSDPFRLTHDITIRLQCGVRIKRGVILPKSPHLLSHNLILYHDFLRSTPSS